MHMTYKIAFASNDGVQVNEHFGRAEKFYIYSLDTENEDYSFLEARDVPPPCKGGTHEAAGFEAVMNVIGDVSAIVAQRAGQGAAAFIRQKGTALYQIPLEIEQALCLLLEDRTWEVDKWQYHTKN